MISFAVSIHPFFRVLPKSPFQHRSICVAFIHHYQHAHKPLSESHSDSAAIEGRDVVVLLAQPLPRPNGALARNATRLG